MTNKYNAALQDLDKVIDALPNEGHFDLAVFAAISLRFFATHSDTLQESLSYHDSKNVLPKIKSCTILHIGEKEND